MSEEKRFEALMNDIHQWSVDNFGETPFALQMMGVLEEIGEYHEAVEMEYGKVKEDDAVNDMFIFLLDAYWKCQPMLAPMRQFNMGLDGLIDKLCADVASYEFKDLVDDFCYGKMWALLARGTLEASQKIRSDQGVVALGKSIYCILGLAVNYYQTPDKLYDNVMITWSEVRKRNWKAYPDTGMAGSSNVTQVGTPLPTKPIQSEDVQI